MSQPLDIARIDITAQSCYDRWLSRCETPLHADPTAIACMAVRLTRMYSSGEYTAEKNANITLATYAAKLSDAIARWGLNFDDVVEVAGFAIAQLVAAVSPDLRAPAGPRHLDLKTRLYQAPPLAQLIKLAAILCTASRVLSDFEQEDYLEYEDELREWAERSLDIVSAFAKVAARKDVAPYMQQARTLLDRILGEVDASLKARKAARESARLAAVPA